MPIVRPEKLLSEGDNRAENEGQAGANLWYQTETTSSCQEERDSTERDLWGPGSVYVLYFKEEAWVSRRLELGFIKSYDGHNSHGLSNSSHLSWKDSSSCRENYGNIPFLFYWGQSCLCLHVMSTYTTSYLMPFPKLLSHSLSMGLGTQVPENWIVILWWSLWLCLHFSVSIIGITGILEFFC